MIEFAPPNFGYDRRMTKPVELGVARNLPVESVVSTLEEWLGDAKSGELRGLLLVGQRTGEEIRRAYAGEYTYPDMVYACELAKFDLISRAKEDDRDVDRS